MFKATNFLEYWSAGHALQGLSACNFSTYPLAPDKQWQPHRISICTIRRWQGRLQGPPDTAVQPWQCCGPGADAARVQVSYDSACANANSSLSVHGLVCKLVEPSGSQGTALSVHGLFCRSAAGQGGLEQQWSSTTGYSTV